MKQRLADYLADRLVEAGICQVFTVTGGGAMHLNDALGHKDGLHCIYNHHEQASAIAAEAYARIHNRIAALCVTTGPGGTNAITGVVGGWLDSIPMLVLSGQVRYDTTARWSGVGIRAMGDQEFDICKAISCMTKYSEMVIDPMRIRFCLEKALYLAKSGRPGPCWLDIPLNVQSAVIETEELAGFDAADYEAGGTGWENEEARKAHGIPEDQAGAGEKRQVLPGPVSRKKAAEVQEVQDGGEDVPAEEEQSESGQPQKLRMPGRRRQRVVSIDAERTVETDTDRLRNDLLDLVESLKSKKILTGTIQGVERLADNPEMSYAVIYHGDFKVIIPVLEAIEEPEDYRGQPKGDVLHYLLNKRLGAEVDYIVKGIDQEHNVVAASRLEAMALKRREYYFRTDRDGNYQIYEGIRAEARVISVIRAGIFVDLFGAECYIPLRELSYQRWVDAAQHYQPGQRVLVRVLEVDRSDRSRPRVTASVKQAMENPYEKALKKYVVGNRYVGTVSMVDLNGVFVSLDGGIDCLCTYPKRGRPPRGARATVRILGINHENNRIWGVITHMSTTR